MSPQARTGVRLWLVCAGAVCLGTGVTVPLFLLTDPPLWARAIIAGAVGWGAGCCLARAAPWVAAPMDDDSGSPPAG